MYGDIDGKGYRITNIYINMYEHVYRIKCY